MDRKESVHKHLSDMLAVEQHILDAVEQQRDDDRLRDNVRANKVVIEMERVLKEHVSALKALADQYGVKTQSAAKEAVTKLLGVAAGIYDRVRGKHPLSRDLRDNYTALSLAAMAYTSFHTYGLATGEDRIASLAQRHLKDLTPLLVELSKVLPEVVAEEVGEESEFPVDTSVGPQAVQNTQEAWSREVVERLSPAGEPGAEGGT